MKERSGAVTHKGAPRTVLGEALKPGDRAPDFRLLAGDLSERTMADYAGKPLLISAVPSLTTGICDAQTKRFDEELATLGDAVHLLTVSIDHPWAQTKWCATAGAEKVEMLSDVRDMNFGDAWGTHVKELHLEQRSVFVVDASGTVRYVEYVPQIGQHPDYDLALTALKEVVAG